MSLIENLLPEQLSGLDVRDVFVVQAASKLFIPIYTMLHKTRTGINADFQWTTSVGTYALREIVKKIHIHYTQRRRTKPFSYTSAAAASPAATAINAAAAATAGAAALAMLNDEKLDTLFVTRNGAE